MARYWSCVCVTHLASRKNDPDPCIIYNHIYIYIYGEIITTSLFSLTGHHGECIGESSPFMAEQLIQVAELLKFTQIYIYIYTYLYIYIITGMYL